MLFYGLSLHTDEELRERVHHILRKQEEKRRKEKLSSSNSESSIKSSERSPSHLHAFHHSKKGHTHSPSLSSTKELEIETSVNDGQSGGKLNLVGVCWEIFGGEYCLTYIVTLIY